MEVDRMSDTRKPATAAPSRLLRLPQVIALVGLSRSAILTRVRAGSFPPKFSLGARAVAWRESDVCAWIAARAPAEVPAPPAASKARDKRVATLSRKRERQRPTA